MRAYTFPQLSVRAKAAAMDKYWRDILTEAMGLNLNRQDHGAYDMFTLAWHAMLSSSYTFTEHGDRIAY